MSKYDDCRRVDNRYTTAIGMSSWRFFNVGKYKNQKVKDVCYFNPFYVAWCLENWQGFSLTGYERSNYMKGLERARDIMNISVDQFMNWLKRRVDSGRWEEPSEKNWFNSYIEVASLKR